MSLKERVYSVLLVSASGNLNSSVKSMLPETSYDPVRTVSSVGAARRAAAERSYDFVIVNSPLPDDGGIDFAVDACGRPGTVVLLLAREDVYGEVYEAAAEHGVFLLPKPVSRSAFALALGWMASARERLRGLERKELSIGEKMEEIRLVNRAKWLLIDREKMDEPAAHRYIEKRAMDMCVPRRAVAEEVIGRYSDESHT